MIRPGLLVQPPTLFVNKAAIAGERHAEMTWGAAQAGVAAGVVDSLAEDIIATDRIGKLLLIAAVWVSPNAADAKAVFENNRESTRLALLAGVRGDPTVEELLAARSDPWNPFYRPR